MGLNGMFFMEHTKYLPHLYDPWRVRIPQARMVFGMHSFGLILVIIGIYMD